MGITFWCWKRGGQDSNLRSALWADNRLAGGPNRPLWHLPMIYDVLATEGEGFDPPVTETATVVFKTTALSHSAIPPERKKRPVDTSLWHGSSLA